MPLIIERTIGEKFTINDDIEVEIRWIDFGRRGKKVCFSVDFANEPPLLIELGVGEKFTINDNIEVETRWIDFGRKSKKACFSVAAPPEIKIYRNEILRAIKSGIPKNERTFKKLDSV